jgi:peptide-methionine (R)-S-oxide reductase
MHGRRSFLLGSAAAFLTAACSKQASAAQTGSDARFAASPWRKVTDAEWKRRLPGPSYATLRHGKTERAGSSPLNEEHRAGTFVCAGCGLPLFRSDWKFESGTGWPSFFQVIKENVGTKPDLVLFIPRTEYHCARCLGHQGHLFDDGPRPTGLRYCNNGVALKFVPA